MKMGQVWSKADFDGLDLAHAAIPAIVIEGKLADCCSGKGPEESDLQAAGLGKSLA